VYLVNTIVSNKRLEKESTKGKSYSFTLRETTKYKRTKMYYLEQTSLATSRLCNNLITVLVNTVAVLELLLY
jgi:hypothetical protein